MNYYIYIKNVFYGLLLLNYKKLKHFLGGGVGQLWPYGDDVRWSKESYSQK